jgi:amidase/6-aminohexanoate-cyclic-dimer hydrolase
MRACAADEGAVKPLIEYDALGLAELVAQGEVSALELLEGAIERVAQVNPEINAVVTPMYDHARAAIKAGIPDGPFAGVPFLLKDLRALYAGVPTTSGSRLFAGYVPDHDSELVRRYKQSGLVIFGKTNTPEFACCPSTEGALFGATKNPWNTRHSAGGSSGGAAAAVAARILPAAHGSDGGGSIRIPAACCGVFGFKPTRGVNPAGPDVGEAWSGLSMEHALTISVRDSAALLDVTRGASPGDPYCGPSFERPLSDAIKRPPKGLKIAVQREAMNGAPVSADCLAAVDDAVSLLTDLGHHVEEAVPEYDIARIGAAYPLVIAANVQGAIDQRAEETGIEPNTEVIEKVIHFLGAIGHDRTAADMARAVSSMHATGRQIAPFFQRYDMLLSPVVATPPPLLGVLDTSSDDIDAYLKAVFEFIPFTALANISGTPAMNIPFSWNDEDLPISVHFQSGFGKDDALFALAAQLEEAHPWASRLPGVCAS